MTILLILQWNWELARQKKKKKKKKKTKRTFMYLPASINFTINRQKISQHLLSVKRLETALNHPSRRVAEVNKFGINRQKQVTHASG